MTQAQRYPAPLSNPDNSPAKQEEYCRKISEMDDAALLREVESKVWLSAFASNNPRSCYHWHADALYDEAERRQKPEIYKQGFERARASASR